MMTKKILSLVVALMLIPQIKISAQEMPAIELSASQVVPGQIVEMDLSLKNNPGIVSMILSLTYDKNVMNLISVEDKNIFGTSVHGNNLTKNPYTLCWANDTANQNYTVNGTIVTLVFRISDNAEDGIYPVKVDYNNSQFDIFDVNLNTVDFDISNGFVTIVRDKTMSLSDINSGSMLSFAVNLCGKMEGMIFCVLYYDGKTNDIKIYPPKETVNISVFTGNVDYVKLMWWNTDSLMPYCESVKLDI